MLAASTRPHAPASITVVNCSEGSGIVITAGEVVDVKFVGMGAGVSATGARARTIGRAKAETTMPVVTK